MKFFIENQKVEKELEWVLTQVRLHMNGATSAQMEERGIKYRINYGVSIPHLKQLAKRIPVSYELAERLWFMEIRETMILAAIIVPEDTMSLERCLEWSEKVINVDILERSAMFLWGRIALSEVCAFRWLNENSGIKKALAFYTIGRMVQLKGPTDAYSISDIIKMLSVTEGDIYVLKAASFLMRTLLRAGEQIEDSLKLFISGLAESTDKNRRLFGEELQTEVDFMNEK